MELLKTLRLIIAAVLISSIQSSSSDESLLAEMKESLVAINAQYDLLYDIYVGDETTTPPTTTPTTEPPTAAPNDASALLEVNVVNNIRIERSVMMFEGSIYDTDMLCVDKELVRASKMCHALVYVSNNLTLLLEVIQNNTFDNSTLVDLQVIESELVNISTEADTNPVNFRKVVDADYGKELYTNVTRDIEATIEYIDQSLEPGTTATDQSLVTFNITGTTEQSEEYIHSSKAAWITLTVIGSLLLISALAFGGYMYYKKSHYKFKSEYYDSEFQPSHVETTSRSTREASDASYRNGAMQRGQDSD